MSQLGYLDLVSSHNSELSDIWGWADGTGNEYAIVGINNGTSVVDVTDPANPIEVFYEPGMASIWRDIKTWNNHAYVTTEAQNGLLIIDLSTLPSNPNLAVTYYTGPLGNEWYSAHNLFIDENGICYIFGANRDNKGVIMLDLSDPINPIEIGSIDNWYTHDGVVRGDTLYMAHIEDGHMSIWDVSSKSSPVLLGQQFTPGNFAHNLWISDDADYIYTTDEISNGFIGEFDISDPTDIIQLDKIQSSPGMDVIPHNTHYMNDYTITSYYRDGVIIHDVSNKGNIVEVANFDTSPIYSGNGYNGCWGVYPWLPSGNIIASDIENGLYVLDVSYNRGCYLTGTITNSSTLAPINGASIEIMTTNIMDGSDISGSYASGIASAGNYDVIYSHPAYISDTMFGVSLLSAQTVVLDVQLDPIVTLNVVFEVIDAIDGITPVSDCQVVIKNNQFSNSGNTAPNGSIQFTNFYSGVYELFIGKWGYEGFCDLNFIVPDNDTTIKIFLDPGYEDLFNLDLGWMTSGNAPDGNWEIGKPNGTDFNGAFANPNEDSDDCGINAYVTGNGGGTAGNDDVDFGSVILTSPLMDLSGYTTPQIQFDYWWVNVSGQVAPNDTLQFIISDGTKDSLVTEILSSSSSSSWQSFSFSIPDFVDLTNSNQFTVQSADWQSNGGNIVEAAFDNFRIVESVGILNDMSANAYDVQIYPNPSTEYFTLKLDLSESVNIEVFDLSGRRVFKKNNCQSGTLIHVTIPGIYTLVIVGENEKWVKKIVKL